MSMEKEQTVKSSEFIFNMASSKSGKLPMMPNIIYVPLFKQILFQELKNF